MKILLETVLALMVSTGIAGAYTSSGVVLSTDGSMNDVQSAINAAAGGNTVRIPAGSFSWSSPVSINNPVTLAGAGQNTTTINGASVLSVSTSSAGIIRITGITFNGGGGQVVLAQFWGASAALVDHCTFIGGNASEMIHNMAYGANDNSGWSNGVVPGSINALYIEDCTFNKNPFDDQYQWGTSAIQSYYGARTVVRHCTLNYCQIDQHGTPGMIGARWWELYNNVLNVPSMSAGECSFMQLRGGSGVIYNNTVNTSQRAHITLYDENGGSSPLYLGRGINQNLSPAYLWGNNGNCDIGSGSSNVVQGTDFFVSASQPTNMKIWESGNGPTTYNYTPLPYPHPMIGGNPTPTPVPPAPTNLKIVP